MLREIEQLREIPQRLRKAEEHGCACQAERIPLAEDQGSKRDKALARDRIVREAACCRQRNRRSAKAGKRAAQHNADIAVFRHADADGVSRARMLADCAETQSERRLEQHEEADDDKHNNDISRRIRPEDARTDNRNIRQERNRYLMEYFRQLARLSRAVIEAAGEINRCPERQNVDNDADYRLIRLERDRRYRMQQREHDAEDGCRNQADPRRDAAETSLRRIIGSNGRCESAGYHQSFQTNVNYARAFREHAAESGEDKRSREYERNVNQLSGYFNKLHLTPPPSASRVCS